MPSDPRFSFANERTFLAWNRTALALIGGGLAASQLLDFGIPGLREVVSLPLIALGAVLGVVGLARWRASELALRLRTPLPCAWAAPALLGLSVGAIAVVAILVLLLDALHP